MNINVIQNGDNTHHQDQSITSHNLRVIKIQPKIAGKGNIWFDAWPTDLSDIISPINLWTMPME